MQFATIAFLMGAPTGKSMWTKRAGWNLDLHVEFDDPLLPSYIVVFNENVEDVTIKAQQLVSKTGARITRVFETAFKGFAVSSLPKMHLNAVLNDDAVKFIEPYRGRSLFHNTVPLPTIWALDRPAQVEHNIINEPGYSYTGKGVLIFIFDGGINLSHEEFGRRAFCGYDAIRGENCEDYRGHGTSVSSLVGGATYGMAKHAVLVAVKIIDDEGRSTFADFLAGIEYVAKTKAANKDQPMVANLSFGIEKSEILNLAVSEIIQQGVVVVVSAGNNSSDACAISPASVDAAITVAATEKNKRRREYSNIGHCVDIFAPGTDILSAGFDGPTARSIVSGTSFAAPLVTGMAALYLERDPTMTPAQVKAAMLADGTAGVVIDKGENSPNLLLNTKVPGLTHPLYAPAVPRIAGVS